MQTLEFIDYGEHQAEIIRSHRSRTATIKVDPGGHISVVVPKRLSRKQISELLFAKQDWIQKKLATLSHMAPYKPKAFTQGESFLYLGQSYLLEIIQGKNKPPQVTDDSIRIYRKNIEPRFIRAALLSFYKTKALRIFNRKVGEFAPIVNVQPKTVTTRTYRRRWGTCNARGEISFNWKLIMAPEQIIDHVVVHELCHLHHFDHSPKFWSEVAKVIPEHKQYQAWLKHHGYTLEI